MIAEAAYYRSLAPASIGAVPRQRRVVSITNSIRIEDAVGHRAQIDGNRFIAKAHRGELILRGKMRPSSEPDGAPRS